VDKTWRWCTGAGRLADAAGEVGVERDDVVLFVRLGVAFWAHVGGVVARVVAQLGR
jgi:hypothetical protein